MDEKNKNLLAQRAQARRALESEGEPLVGDVLVFPGGRKSRVAYVWRAQGLIQPEDRRGSYFLCESGDASFSGSLDGPVEIGSLRRTDARRSARFWIFSNNEWRAHNGIDVNLDVAVWRVET